jgi:hypothetical protein
MPNMEDPVVLELVLCLLEADGDQFSLLSEKPHDSLPYTMVDHCYNNSQVQHSNTDFVAAWKHQTCEVDANFNPTLMYTPSDKEERGVGMPDSSAFLQVCMYVCMYVLNPPSLWYKHVLNPISSAFLQLPPHAKIMPLQVSMLYVVCLLMLFYSITVF